MRGAVTKSIAIIGEGETEWFYFDSLRIAQRYPFRLVPGMPSHSDIGHILFLAEKYLAEKFDYVVCLIDMDRIKQVPSEWRKYQSEKRKRKFRDIWFIETHPCTEYWFLLHFLPNLSTRIFSSYVELLPDLQKYMPGYEKTKKYFNRTNLFCYLQKYGDINRAVENGKILSKLRKDNPEDEISYSEIYKVIELLNNLKPLES
jgi:hypothetical protein